VKRVLILLAILLIPVSGWALTTAQTVVLAGQAIAGSDTLKNAQIKITLVGSICWTTTDLMPAVTITTYANSSGNWSKSIVGTDSITCRGGGKPTYSVEILHSVLQQSGQTIRYDGLVIPATAGATTQLRTILSQQ